MRPNWSCLWKFGFSLASSLKVALLRLTDLLHCQQNTAQTLSVKFTFLCIISVVLLINAVAISAFNFGLYISFYRGNFSLLLYTDNTCGCSEILSFLGNVDLPVPALPQTPNVKALPFHLPLCSQQLLDLSQEPFEEAHVGVKVG